MHDLLAQFHRVYVIYIFFPTLLRFFLFRFVLGFVFILFINALNIVTDVFFANNDTVFVELLAVFFFQRTKATSNEGKMLIAPTIDVVRSHKLQKLILYMRLVQILRCSYEMSRNF